MTPALPWGTYKICASADHQPAHHRRGSKLTGVHLETLTGTVPKRSKRHHRQHEHAGHAERSAREPRRASAGPRWSSCWSRHRRRVVMATLATADHRRPPQHRQGQRPGRRHPAGEDRGRPGSSNSCTRPASRPKAAPILEGSSGTTLKFIHAVGAQATAVAPIPTKTEIKYSEGNLTQSDYAGTGTYPNTTYSSLGGDDDPGDQGRADLAEHARSSPTSARSAARSAKSCPAAAGSPPPRRWA